MASAAEWFREATAGTDAGRLAASVDWAATPLGSPDTWPHALRLAVETCYSTRFPMLVAWGDELTMVYNDAYRLMLGSHKHPGAMGAPATAVWAEVWSVIGPEFDHVMRTGEPTWAEDQLLFIDRDGFVEETYFTYSFSALRLDDGSVGGVLDTCTETTQQVVTARRLATLNELRLRLVTARSTLEVCRAAMAVLRDDKADVGAAAVHITTGGDIISSPEPLADPDDVVRVLGGGEPDCVGDLHLAPLGDVGVLVVRLNPGRPYDDGYASFLGLVSSTLHMALLEARRRDTELARLRRTSETFQRAMLPPFADQPQVATRYLPASGDLQVGGDWYDVIEVDDRHLALVVGDCVGHGLAAATTMGQLRNASRALLLEGIGPAAVLEGLDRFAALSPGAESTTVFCAVVDRETGVVTYSCAGHVPPLVVEGAGTWLDQTDGLPLDIVPERRAEAQFTLSEGSAIVLYTDGLVERRGESLADGFARLASLVPRMAAATPSEVADTVLAELVPEGHEDDVAVVVYRQLSGRAG
jgi:hypothetical protein